MSVRAGSFCAPYAARYHCALVIPGSCTFGEHLFERFVTYGLDTTCSHSGKRPSGMAPPLSGGMGPGNKLPRYRKPPYRLFKQPETERSEVLSDVAPRQGSSRV